MGWEPAWVLYRSSNSSQLDKTILSCKGDCIMGRTNTTWKSVVVGLILLKILKPTAETIHYNTVLHMSVAKLRGWKQS